MSGIWNRVHRSGVNGDYLSSHLLKAAIYLSVRGVFTNSQIIDALNSGLRTPLSGQELTDLEAMLLNATQGTATAKLDYLERFDALNIAAEAGLLSNESTYRTQMGI